MTTAAIAEGAELSSVPSAGAGAPRRRVRRRQRLVTIALLAPAFLILASLLAPLAVVLSRSFTDPELGLQNYRALVDSSATRQIFIATFRISLVTTVACLVLAFPYTYWLTRLSPRLRGIILILTLAPLFTAILARLYAWTIVLGRRGLINYLLEAANLQDEPADLLFNERAVQIGMVHVLLPYMVILLYATMREIDPNLLAAARSLGGSSTQVFFRVFLPLAKPGVYAGCLLVFIMALGYFTTPAVLGGSVVTIAIFIQQQIDNLGWANASTQATVLLAITVLLFAALSRIYGVGSTVIGGTRK